MAKNAKQIFAEADEILKDCFYVTDASNLAGKKTKKGKQFYPTLGEGSNCFLCSLGNVPRDGGLGRADLSQGNLASDETTEAEYFDAQTERKRMRKRDRAERVLFYREQVESGEFDENMTFEYDERVSFSHGTARNESFTKTYGMNTSE